MGGSSYFSTFPAGFGGIIERIIHADYPETAICRQYDNAVLHRSNERAALLSAPYFHNTFRAIELVECDPNDDLGVVAERLCRGIDGGALRDSMRGCRSFRVVFLRENLPVPVDEAIRARLEARITSLSGRPAARRGAETEVQVTLRREGVALLLVRLRRSVRPAAGSPVGRPTVGRPTVGRPTVGRPTVGRPTVGRPPGMLGAEIGSLLCRYSEPSPDDVFLDPFCGYGGIFLERMRWKYRLAFAIDHDERCVQSVRERLAESAKNWRKRTYVRTGDGTSLAELDTGFVTSIVTDPPWGEYDRGIDDPDAFYSKFLSAFSRVLAPDGTVVLLAGRAVAVERILGSSSIPLRIDESCAVLVSGKKATVYRIRRATR